MRSIILAILFFIAQTALAQPPSKTEIQNQMTQVVNKMNQQISDLEKQIAEARKNKVPEESIKPLEDQLAMLRKQVSAMSGVTQGISNMSVKTIQQTSKDENSSGVPERDNNRIKMLPDKILSDDELPGYLKKITLAVENKMSATDRANAAELFTQVNKIYKTQQLSGIANTCWMNGHPELALYIMGRVCLIDISNGNNLNNYASFLSMSGAEHAALPILENINQKYPDNSTILNNIGQAWYGLGDMNNSKQFLDKCIRFYGLHSQANRTMCEIQKSEGKQQESIESLKRSIAEDYTPEKEHRLNELGGKLSYDDIPFHYPIKAEPLGIEGFFNAIPEYAFQGGDVASSNNLEWSEFIQKIDMKAQPLEAEKKQLEIKVKNYSTHLLTNTSQLLKPYNNNIHKTASRKYALLDEWATDRLVALDKKRMAAMDSVKKWKEEYTNALAKATSCEVKFDLATQFNTKANSLWQEVNSQLLSFLKQDMNARSNLYLYVATDQSMYELEIVNIKLGVLNFISDLHREFEVGCFPTEKPNKPGGKKLPDFDELNCTHKSELWIPPFTIITIECNKMKTELEFDTQLGPKFKGEIEENLATGKYTKGTLEVGYSKSIDKMTYGPLKAESKLEVAAGMEFNGQGITDMYVKGGVKGKLGTNVNTTAKTDEFTVNPSTGQHDIIVESIPETDPNYIKDQSFTAAGLDVKVSWNSGFSAKGSGFLKGISIK